MRIWTLACVTLLALSSLALAQAPAQPAPEHALFKKMAGDWDCTINASGQQLTGRSSFRSEFNGLHLVQDFSGNFGGQEFHGRGTTSYCPVRKKFLANWVDDMTATPTRSEGSLSADGKTFTELGEGSDGQGGLLKVKGVTQLVSDDEMTYTMYSLQNNQETEMMKIVYKRRPK